MAEDPRVEPTHELCTSNRLLLAETNQAACFYCLAIFRPSEIERWLPEGDGTAMCPRCNIDSVIPWQDWMTPDFLKAMQVRWFGAD